MEDGPGAAQMVLLLWTLLPKASCVLGVLLKAKCSLTFIRGEIEPHSYYKPGDPLNSGVVAESPSFIFHQVSFQGTPPDTLLLKQVVIW